VKGKVAAFYRQAYNEFSQELNEEVQHLQTISQHAVRLGQQSPRILISANVALSARRHIRMLLEKLSILLMEPGQYGLYPRRLPGVGTNTLNYVLYCPEVQEALVTCMNTLKQVNQKAETVAAVESAAANAAQVSDDVILQVIKHEARLLRKEEQIAECSERLAKLSPEENRESIDAEMAHLRKGFTHYNRCLEEKRAQYRGWMDARADAAQVRTQVKAAVDSVVNALKKRIDEVIAVSTADSPIHSLHLDQLDKHYNLLHRFDTMDAQNAWRSTNELFIRIQQKMTRYQQFVDSLPIADWRSEFPRHIQADVRKLVASFIPQGSKSSAQSPAALESRLNEGSSLFTKQAAYLDFLFADGPLGDNRGQLELAYYREHRRVDFQVVTGTALTAAASVLQ